MINNEEEAFFTLSVSVAGELDEALLFYQQIITAMISYLAADEEEASTLRSLQNSALTLAISLSDLGRTLDDLDAEGFDDNGGDDPRGARPLIRALADSLTLLLAVKSQEDCYKINILDEDEIADWLLDLTDWRGHLTEKSATIVKEA